MNKRIVVALSLIIAIVLCVPSVPAYADSNNFKVVTHEILVSNFGDKSSLANGFYQKPQTFFEGFNVEAFNDVSSLPFDPFADGVYYALYSVSNGNLYLVAVDCSNIPGNFSSAYTNQGLTICTDNIAEQMPQARTYGYYFNKTNSNWVVGSALANVSFTREFVRYVTNQDQSLENLPAQNNKYPITHGHTDDVKSFLTVGALSNLSLAFTNADHVYTLENLWNYYYASDSTIGSLISNYWGNICSSGKWVQDMNSSMYDFQMDGMTPYYDGSDVIDPAPPEESNENHLYLNNVDAGFCKPITQDDLSGAGGGYFYLSYNFDSWINSHHGDYYLEFVSLIGVDGVQYGRTQNLDLDMGGVNIMPFLNLSDNDDWTNNALLFVEYPEELTSNFNYGYVYSMPYLKYIATDYQGVTNADKLGKFRVNDHTWSYGSARGTGNMINRILLTPLGGQTYDISKMSFGDRLESLFESVNHNSFIIDVQFSLVDRVSGEKSGLYRKSFDLLNGVVNIQSNNIKDNTNPYIPIDNELALVDDNSNGGYLPSYGYGSNNQIVNFSTPDNIKLFIDNGFSQFLAWYETSADTAYVTNRFWSSMGIFEENPAIPLYRTYFGFLPEDFKAIIFGCAGIGIIGGAFCILRRRLH